MACKIKSGGVVKSTLGDMMGHTMRAYECLTHNQKWSSSRKAEKFCHIGAALVCMEQDTLSDNASCQRCGLNHKRVRAMFAKSVPKGGR